MKLVRIAAAVVLLIAAVYLLIAGQALLIPFVLACFLAYIIHILAAFFRHPYRKGPRLAQPVAFGFAFVSIFGPGYLFFVLISDSVRRFMDSAVQYQLNINKKLQPLLERFGLGDVEQLWQQIADFQLNDILQNVAGSVANIVSQTGLILVFLLFILIEARMVPIKIRALVQRPQRRREITALLLRIDRSIRVYLGVKTFVSFLTALLSYAVMAVMGLDFAILWALLIFALNYIPNIGSVVATALPAALALAQFDSLAPFLVIGIGVTMIQLFVANVIEPRMMGRSLNLSPLVIILSLFVWGMWWGVAGMFLCVPLTAVLVIICANFPQTRFIAVLLSSDGRLPDPHRDTGAPPEPLAEADPASAGEAAKERAQHLPR